jgi:hypothetical protein
MPEALLRLKTIATAINLLIPQGDWRPLQVFTREPISEDEVITSLSGRKLAVQLWRPKNITKQTVPGIVIYTPFIHGGRDDQRHVNLALTFARAGFLVAAPWRSEDPFIINLKDRLKLNHCGLFGISVGNGPIVAAAADPRIRESVSFIISFAGYYDVQNVLQFIRTGRYSYKSISGRAEPDPYAREILTKALDFYNRCSVESLLNDPEFKKLVRLLSPCSFIDQLKAEFFIIHSSDDIMIPYTESLRLADALRDRVPVHFAQTNVFEHGTYRKLSFRNILHCYLPSITEFLRLVYSLLSRYS